MNNGLNLLYPRKDIAEMVVNFGVFSVVPEGLVRYIHVHMCVNKKHT